MANPCALCGQNSPEDAEVIQSTTKNRGVFSIKVASVFLRQTGGPQMLNVYGVFYMYFTVFTCIYLHFFLPKNYPTVGIYINIDHSLSVWGTLHLFCVCRIL